MGGPETASPRRSSQLATRKAWSGSRSWFGTQGMSRSREKEAASPHIRHNDCEGKLCPAGCMENLVRPHATLVEELEPDIFALRPALTPARSGQVTGRATRCKEHRRRPLYQFQEQSKAATVPGDIDPRR